MVRNNDQHGGLESSERVGGVTVSTAGLNGVRQVRQNAQHGGLEVIEEETA